MSAQKEVVKEKQRRGSSSSLNDLESLPPLSRVCPAPPSPPPASMAVTVAKVISTMSKNNDSSTSSAAWAAIMSASAGRSDRSSTRDNGGPNTKERKEIHQVTRPPLEIEPNEEDEESDKKPQAHGPNHKSKQAPMSPPPSKMPPQMSIFSSLYVRDDDDDDDDEEDGSLLNKDVAPGTDPPSVGETSSVSSNLDVDLIREVAQAMTSLDSSSTSTITSDDTPSLPPQTPPISVRNPSTTSSSEPKSWSGRSTVVSQLFPPHSPSIASKQKPKQQQQQHPTVTAAAATVTAPPQYHHAAQQATTPTATALTYQDKRVAHDFGDVIMFPKPAPTPNSDSIDSRQFPQIKHRRPVRHSNQHSPMGPATHPPNVDKCLDSGGTAYFGPPHGGRTRMIAGGSGGGSSSIAGGTATSSRSGSSPHEGTNSSSVSPLGGPSSVSHPEGSSVSSGEMLLMQYLVESGKDLNEAAAIAANFSVESKGLRPLDADATPMEEDIQMTNTMPAHGAKPTPGHDANSMPQLSSHHPPYDDDQRRGLSMDKKIAALMDAGIQHHFRVDGNSPRETVDIHRGDRQAHQTTTPNAWMTNMNQQSVVLPGGAFQPEDFDFYPTEEALLIHNNTGENAVIPHEKKVMTEKINNNKGSTRTKTKAQDDWIAKEKLAVAILYGGGGFGGPTKSEMVQEMVSKKDIYRKEIDSASTGRFPSDEEQLDDWKVAYRAQLEEHILSTIGDMEADDAAAWESDFMNKDVLWPVSKDGGNQFELEDKKPVPELLSIGDGDVWWKSDWKYHAPPLAAAAPPLPEADGSGSWKSPHPPPPPTTSSDSAPPSTSLSAPYMASRVANRRVSRPGAHQVNTRALGQQPSWARRLRAAAIDEDSVNHEGRSISDDMENTGSNSHIIEATAISHPSPSIVEPGIAYAKAETMPSGFKLICQDRKSRWCLFFCTLIFVGIALSIVFIPRSGGGGSDDELFFEGNVEPEDDPSTQFLMPSAAPTESLQPTSDLSAIKEHLSRFSDINDLNTPGTPQYLAMVWLATVDQVASFLLPNTSPSSSSKLVAPSDLLSVQRYATAVLYFATYNNNGGDGSHHQSVSEPDSGWLVADNWLDPNMLECDWGGGITCSTYFGNQYVTAIDLSKNSLEGTIPPEIGLFPRLVQLDLRENRLRGSIPTELGNLPMLSTFNVQNNLLTGSIPGSLGLSKDMTTLIVSNNNLIGTLTDELWGMNTLRTLDLSFNKLSGTLSKTMSELRALTLIDVRSNLFSGSLDGVLSGMEDLAFIYFDNNLFSGEFPADLSFAPRRVETTFSNNVLSGTLPLSAESRAAFSFFTSEGVDFTGFRLRKMDLSRNLLEGTLPALLGYMPTMKELNFSSNLLTGPIPNTFGLFGLATNLVSIGLAENSFNGTVPNIGNLQRTRVIDLHNNSLQGGIPTFFGRLEYLEQLDLSGNKLGSSIPTELGSMSSLRNLLLQNCGLGGSIPTELGNLVHLEVADMSQNALSRTIPYEIGNILSLRKLLLESNQLVGKIPTTIGLLRHLRILKLNDNSLGGPIPDELASLLELEELHLEENSLSGLVPEKLCRLHDHNLDLVRVDCEVICGCCQQNIFNSCR